MRSKISAIEISQAPSRSSTFSLCEVLRHLTEWLRSASSSINRIHQKPNSPPALKLQNPLHHSSRLDLADCCLQAFLVTFLSPQLPSPDLLILIQTSQFLFRSSWLGNRVHEAEDHSFQGRVPRKLRDSKRLDPGLR